MSNESNHPNHIKKEIPSMINKRLNTLSKTKKEFDFVKADYQEALKRSKYKPELQFDDKTMTKTDKKKRRRKIIYFQPPFSLTIKTPIGKLFLKLVKKHFTESNPLSKILNFRCLKLSYCCMNNIKSEITANNRRLTSSNSDHQPEKLCNCRSRTVPCPLDKKCLTSNIVYRADIKTNDNDHKIYIGTSGNSFKERYAGHKTTFKHKQKKNSTELSKYFWKLTDEGKSPQIEWSIVRKIIGKASLRSGCNLCNTERYEIARAEKDKLLNIRNERKRICPHYAKQFF